MFPSIALCASNGSTALFNGTVTGWADDTGATSANTALYERRPRAEDDEGPARGGGFDGAVLLAGYSSPMHSLHEREQEGSEVAMAAAARVSRVHAVIGARDTVSPTSVYQSYFDAMRAGGVRVHTLAGVDHDGVYNSIALGATQDHASVLSECRHALLPERTVRTIHV